MTLINLLKDFLKKFNSLLDLYTHCKKNSVDSLHLAFENKYLLKTTTSQNMLNWKTHHIRTEAQNKNKQYRNLLSKILKQSKQSYFTNFFQDNFINLKNTWKGKKYNFTKTSELRIW